MANLRKLGRRTDHRTAMLRNLVQSLFENGKIETTVTRAKEARREAEKMITLGKKGDLSARREALKYIYLSLIHISEPTRRHHVSRMPSSA